MTMVQRIAQIFGGVFILVALLGIVLTGATMQTKLLLGLFPVNLLHNAVHFFFGVWGMLASRTVGAALTFCRIGGIVYLVLAGLALVTPTTFGLIPIGGHDIWLHGVIGIVLVYFGFAGEKVGATA